MKRASVLLDSSVWIEILSSGPRAAKCQKELDQSLKVIVPTAVIFEVYRKLASLLAEDVALSAITVLLKNEVKDFTQDVALLAADLSLENKLGMADAMVLAHARVADSLFITMDNDFSGLDDVLIIR